MSDGDQCHFKYYHELLQLLNNIINSWPEWYNAAVTHNLIC